MTSRAGGATLYFVVYPNGVWRRVRRAAARGSGAFDADAAGVAANFSCGSFVRFDLSVDREGVVRAAGIRSNGCGYMIAAADVIAEEVAGRHVTELHGLRWEDLRALLAGAIGEMPPDREGCVDAAIDALRASFADLRSRRVKEFRGEEALICTCFGVTEERIETIIAERHPETVDDVTAVCNAGAGCGSCRMLIEEMLEQGRR